MTLPAMLRFKRLSAVTAMIAMTMPMSDQRTRLAFEACMTPAAESNFCVALVLVFKRFPYSVAAARYRHFKRNDGADSVSHCW